MCSSDLQTPNPKPQTPNPKPHLLIFTLFVSLMENPTGQQSKSATTKYLILVRHGERVDETAGLHDIVSYDDQRDSSLTERGKLRSMATGKKLAALLDEYGLMNGKCLKVKYICSVIYRCMQTMAGLRDGIGQYVHHNKEKFENYEAVNKAFLRRKTHIEEACSEKKLSVTPEYVANLRIRTHNKEILQEFSKINPVYKYLYDYENVHAHLSLNQKFEKKKQANKYLHMFFDDIFERLMKDDDHSAYVVVAHSKYIKQLNKYLDLPPLECDVDYNAASILEFKTDGSKSILMHNVQLHSQQ